MNLKNREQRIHYGVLSLSSTEPEEKDLTRKIQDVVGELWEVESSRQQTGE